MSLSLNDFNLQFLAERTSPVLPLRFQVGPPNALKACGFGPEAAGRTIAAPSQSFGARTGAQIPCRLNVRPRWNRRAIALAPNGGASRHGRGRAGAARREAAQKPDPRRLDRPPHFLDACASCSSKASRASRGPRAARCREGRRSPTHALTRAHAVLRARRRIASADSAGPCRPRA